MAAITQVQIQTEPACLMIESAQQLHQLTQKLEQARTVAVDLEADSMYHLREKVCLIQVASHTATAVIDPLAIGDLSSLKPLFARQDIRKIFHGADYDVRSLFRDFGIEINNLFDTELASRFLGYRESGLESVLRHRFALALDKKYQKKDWSKRPLPRDMIDYAARDVIYLIPLSQILIGELDAKKRLSWVLEECELLSAVRPMTNSGAPLFLKFKGAGRLRPRGLAVLEALLQFRQNAAASKDRPVFKIIRNDALLKITTSRPATLKRLRSTGVLSERQISLFGHGVIEAVKRAVNLPAEQLPVYPRKKPAAINPAVPPRLKALKAWRDAKARDLALDPALLCNKALLNIIADRNPLSLETLDTISEMRQWQRRECGPDLIAILGRMAQKDAAKSTSRRRRRHPNP